MRCLALSALLVLAVGCDTTGADPVYTGPADYAYTLTASCFCIYSGPIRVTVVDGEIVEAEALSDQGVSQDVIDNAALTLRELTEIAARAEREGDEVSVTYDPTYGFPTRLDIDWIRNASDDEISYRAEAFESR